MRTRCTHASGIVSIGNGIYTRYGSIMVRNRFEVNPSLKKRCRFQSGQVLDQALEAAFPGAPCTVNRAEIPAGQVGFRFSGGKGGAVPIHMEIDILALFILHEKPVGAALGAEQVALFHG